MEFIDHTGHIFSLPSYNSKPIGYEYEENKYMFWFDSEYGYKLSVDNYYFKPIRILVPINSNVNLEDYKINISVDSSIFSLIGAKQIQTLLSRNESFNDKVELNESDFKKELNKDDLLIIDTISEKLYTGYNVPYYTYQSNGVVFQYDGDIIEHDGKKYGNIEFGPLTSEVELIENNQFIKYNSTNEYETIDGETVHIETIYQKYAIIPFYCVCYSSDEAVWETNVLISLSTDNGNTYDYCPITVAAEIVDEIEELIINGKNMGVKLPKQILKAVYQSSFYNEYPDERLYTQKLKEYMMNFMNIKGNQGNFKSAINSLKWFGWGDKVSIHKLLKTDNTIQSQYIRDYFDVINDTLYSYQMFRNSTFISLSVNMTYDEKEDAFNFNNDVWGENKPVVKNINDTLVTVHYDEGDIDFYKTYFDYTFNELGLKLCALKYYYQKYFLPLHLNVLNASLEHKCYTNDIKFIVKPSTFITEKPLLTNSGIHNSVMNFSVELPYEHTLYFKHETHYIDGNYNEFENNYELGTKYDKDIFFIDDTLVSLPIKFICDNETYFDCHLILTKDDEIIHECNFQFIQNPEDRNTYYRNFIIHPKTINTVITGEQQFKFDVNYWIESKYSLKLLVNGKWYTYDFNLALPELNIDYGVLQYKYYLPYYSEYTVKNNKPTLFKQIIGFNDNGVPKFNAYMHQPDLVTVNNMDFVEESYASKNSMIEYINKYYNVTNNFIDNKYLNICHLMDIFDANGNPVPYTANVETAVNKITIGDKTMFYGDNTESDTLKKYKCFFTDDGESIFDNVFEYNRKYITLNNINGINYDFYLMHDYERWYGVFISVDTVNVHTDEQLRFVKKTNANVLEIMIDGTSNLYYDETYDDAYMHVINHYDISECVYTLKFNRTDKKLLINRMDYVSMNGVNHFNNDDIIVCTLKNNDKLPFKLGLGSKWKITPMSINMGDEAIVDSPNEMAIISIGNKNAKYERGYYNVSVQYSLDDFIQHNVTKNGKFRVE